MGVATFIVLGGLGMGALGWWLCEMFRVSAARYERDKLKERVASQSEGLDRNQRTIQTIMRQRDAEEEKREESDRNLKSMERDFNTAMEWVKTIQRAACCDSPINDDTEYTPERITE